MSTRYVSLDRVRGLNALRRSSAVETLDGRQSSLLDDESHSRTRSMQLDPDRLSRILGATPKTNQYGDYLSVRCWCARPPRYSPELGALKLLAPDAADEISDPEQWLFLDTETTGLAGGSGTYAFLVGIAWWENGGLEIEQFLLREYSEERSTLLALRERIAERPVLVTFNGKSFDWPLLETRYRMSRKISAPTLRAHLDFLHPARSLWRLRLGSVRLSELERHVLGWDRGADLLSGAGQSHRLSYLDRTAPRRTRSPASALHRYGTAQALAQGLASVEGCPRTSAAWGYTGPTLACLPAVEVDRVKGSGGEMLADLVTLVRHALIPALTLVPYRDELRQRYQAWLEHRNADTTFTAEQREWLDRMAEHIGTSLSIAPDHFEDGWFGQHGSLGRAHALFGNQLKPLTSELNEGLAA